MHILEDIIIVALVAASFFAGVGLANCFNKQALAEQKEALEKQYLRLKANADADDPCKPYRYFANTSPLPSPQFEERLKQDGKAIAKLERTKRS